MRDHDISQRRACRLVGVDPRTVRRERPPERAIEGAIGSSPMASPEIREEMKDIAGKRRRFGYRRIGVLRERKGMIMNHKKLYRLYREDGGGSENSPGDCFPDDTVGEATTRAQAGPRHTHADAAGGASPRSLVARLPGGQLRRLVQVPHSGGDRRLLSREPVPDRRYQHLGRSCRPRAGCAGADLRKACLHRQRSTRIRKRSGGSFPRGGGPSSPVEPS